MKFIRENSSLDLFRSSLYRTSCWMVLKALTRSMNSTNDLSPWWHQIASMLHMECTPSWQSMCPNWCGILIWFSLVKCLFAKIMLTIFAKVSFWQILHQLFGSWMLPLLLYKFEYWFYARCGSSSFLGHLLLVVFGHRNTKIYKARAHHSSSPFLVKGTYPQDESKNNSNLSRSFGRVMLFVNWFIAMKLWGCYYQMWFCVCTLNWRICRSVFRFYRSRLRTTRLNKISATVNSIQQPTAYDLNRPHKPSPVTRETWPWILHNYRQRVVLHRAEFQSVLCLSIPNKQVSCIARTTHVQSLHVNATTCISTDPTLLHQNVVQWKLYRASQVSFW